MKGRLPRPLVALLAAVLLLGVAWALVVPAWQVPDENAHWAYLQSLVERRALPGAEDQPLYSSEQKLALDRSNAEQTAGILATKPEWSEEAYAAWRGTDRALGEDGRRDGGGVNPAQLNPPLYYAYATLAYVVASGGDVFDRLYLVRMWSALLLLATTAAAWLFAGEVFGRDRLLQLVAAGLAGLLPMASFISASVHPDALLIPLWSVVLWLGVRIIRRGATLGATLALLAAAALALATKPVTAALLPAVAFALLAAWRRTRKTAADRGEPAPPGERRRGVLAAAVVAGAAAVGGLVALAAILVPAVSAIDPRLLASYLWQFYLPKLPFQQDFGTFRGLPLYEVWIKGAWGAFGWLEIKFSEPVYAVLAALTVAVLAAALLAAVRRRTRIDRSVVAFCALAGIFLLAALHLAEANYLSTERGAFIQARYLFPLLPLAGVTAASALTLIRPARRGIAAGVALGGLVALQLFSLATVVGRFYA